jgi:hypothetical protein
MWPRCHAFGLSSRIITHIENDADPDFWKPKWESDKPETRVTSHVGELVIPKGKPPGPVFSGILRAEDKGKGEPLLLAWAPAFDPDAHLPIRYEVCLAPSRAAMQNARPTLTTGKTHCELTGLKSGTTHCIRVVPVNAKGQRCASALQDAAFVREIKKQ